MGHSFGGITVLAALGDCKQAKAAVVFDPWFYPRVGEEISAGDKKTFMVFTRTFEEDCKKLTKDTDKYCDI